ncbi:MAG: peptidase MA family metallohydrolase [Chloroflexota bacterium]
MIILATGLLLFGSSWTVVAQEPVFTTSVDYEFGQVIRFEISGEDVVGAESVILFFRPEGSENTYTDEAVVNFAERFTVQHEIDLTQLRIDPFTEVQYWWLIPTEDEDVFTPTESFFYEDDQFEWQFMQQGPITVHWTGEDASLGQTAVDVVEDTLVNVRPFIPDAVSRPLRVYIYPTAADLRAALRLSGRDWVGGHASPELGVILVSIVNMRTAAADLRRSIPHEMVHVLLHQTVHVNGTGRLPVWFNEGLATYVEETQNPNYSVVLETAVSNQSTLPFVELCQTFPTAEEEAVLAYAQSHSFVSYLQSRFGNQALGQIILAHRDGADCQAGVARALQISLIDLNEDWLEQLEPPTPLAYFFDVTGFWLLLILVGFGITGLLIFKPSRE